MSREFDFTVPEKLNNKRLDLVASSLLKEQDPDNEALYTRSFVQRIIEEDGITVNFKTSAKSMLIKQNDIIHIILPDPIDPVAKPEEIELEIIYEDEDVLVVNKPKGMVVHPAAGNPSGTLVNALLWHCSGNLSGINGVNRPGIVHRIDKDTSGLLVVAKNDKAHLSLSEQISSHTVTREYFAIVYGIMPESKGTVDAPIGRSVKDRKKFTVTEKNSKNAVTDYEVLETIGNYSFLKLKLHTGRTHQIRVHMSSIGHPLAGDAVYGPRNVIKELNGQCLHAGTLGFIHPRTGEYMEFHAELPEYFTDFLAKLRRTEYV